MDSGDSGNQYCMTKHGCSYPQIVYWLRVSGVWNYPIRWAYIKCSRSILYSVFILDDNVLIVIGGDSYYRDENEEVRFVISRWARKKVASQFSEEYLDGRQSFIFSWHKKHRMIHEEAMRHFLDPDKRGSKFEYTLPRPLPKPIPPVIPQRLSKPKTTVATFAGRNVRQEVRAIVFTLYSWELTGRSRF